MATAAPFLRIRAFGSLAPCYYNQEREMPQAKPFTFDKLGTLGGCECEMLTHSASNQQAESMAAFLQCLYGAIPWGSTHGHTALFLFPSLHHWCLHMDLPSRPAGWPASPRGQLGNTQGKGPFSWTGPFNGSARFLDPPLYIYFPHFLGAHFAPLKFRSKFCWIFFFQDLEKFQGLDFFQHPKNSSSWAPAGSAPSFSRDSPGLGCMTAPFTFSREILLTNSFGNGSLGLVFF